MQTDSRQAAELLRKPRAVFGTRSVAVYEPQTYTVQPLIAEPHTNTWNLDLVGAPAAWPVTEGKGTTVAVIDTGIDYRHPDLANRFDGMRGVDFVFGREPLDDNGHGTHVAGTIAGKKTGVAPATTLYAVKVLDMHGIGSEVAVLKGIEWAIKKEVDVINMSLGSSYSSTAEEELIRVAYRRGIAVVCAAGNDGDGSYNFPASHEGAISVAAVDSQKQRAPFSNYNDMVDLSAPGVGIYSTWLGGGYKVISGTSMATPHVAGAAALVKSVGKPAMETVLKETASPLGRADYYGSGLIQLSRAVK
jgi:subtilisin family serine protease